MWKLENYPSWKFNENFCQLQRESHHAESIYVKIDWFLLKIERNKGKKAGKQVKEKHVYQS